MRLASEELLDQGIGVDDPTASDFVAAGAWGWDDMVPNLKAAAYPGAGEWAGVALPDHGEAWRLPWSVREHDGTSVSMECFGRLLPWSLTRRIELHPRAVRLTYTYSNRGRDPLYAYWCAHPLFRYESDMAVAGLPHVEPGTSRKVFLPPAAIDHVRLAWRSGTAVEVAWDPSLTRHAAIWVCDGDLGGYRQIAIEPATGANDGPDLSEPPPLLGAGEELRWWLEIRDGRPA